MSRSGRSLLCFFLTIIVLVSLSSGVHADADPLKAPPFAPHSDLSVVDAEELSSMAEAFLAEHKIREGNLNIAFCYTGTGECWSYNGDTFIDGCSLYKLALNMLLAQELRAGTLTPDTKISGFRVSDIMSRSLINSNNPVSEAALSYLGGIKTLRKAQAELAGFSEDELPPDYYQNIAVSPDMMIGILKNIYTHPETYPEVIENMLLANPGHYFKMNLQDSLPIAQKYGGRPTLLHTAAILYTPTPIFLVVMTKSVSHADEVLGEIAELMADYAHELDERLEDALEEKERQEKAAEESRIAAEKEAEEQCRSEMNRISEELHVKLMTSPVARAESPLPFTAFLPPVAVCAGFLIRRLLRRKK